MKQRILVLGANGYVGRRVVAALAASDWAEPVAGVRRARSKAARSCSTPPIRPR
ncbi:NAD-dependent epimerase/dehydratase family protein [Achromobacter insuavis]